MNGINWKLKQTYWHIYDLVIKTQYFLALRGMLIKLVRTIWNWKINILNNFTNILFGRFVCLSWAVDCAVYFWDTLMKCLLFRWDYIGKTLIEEIDKSLKLRDFPFEKFKPLKDQFEKRTLMPGFRFSCLVSRTKNLNMKLSITGFTYNKIKW